MPEIYKRYTKTILGIVGGRMLEHRSKGPVDFLLRGDPEADDQFSYDDLVLEMYDEEEDKFFRRLNRSHLANGVLVEYSKENTTKEESVNAISITEIDSILEMKPVPLEKALAKFTSNIPLERILSRAQQQEKPSKIIAVITKALEPYQPKFSGRLQTSGQTSAVVTRI